MYPLLIFSLLIWAVVIEKVYFLIKFKKDSELVFSKAIPLIKDKKFNEAKGLFHHAHPLIGTPFLTALEDRELATEVKSGRLKRRVIETEVGLRRYLWLLGTISSSAPFIGLFGTVVGIIKSFDSIAQAGKSGFAVVAADLSEALVATAAGIGVAVLAVLLFNYFQTWLKQTSLEFRHRLEDFVDTIQ